MSTPAGSASAGSASAGSALAGNESVGNVCRSVWRGHSHAALMWHAPVLSHEGIAYVLGIINSPNFIPNSRDPDQMHVTYEYICHQVFMLYILDKIARIKASGASAAITSEYILEIIRETFDFDESEHIHDTNKLLTLHASLTRYLTNHHQYGRSSMQSIRVFPHTLCDETSHRNRATAIDPWDITTVLGNTMTLDQLVFQLLPESRAIYEMPQKKFDALLDTSASDEENRYILRSSRVRIVRLNHVWGPLTMQALDNRQALGKRQALDNRQMVYFNCPLSEEFIFYVHESLDSNVHIGITQRCGLPVSSLTEIIDHIYYLEYDDFPYELARTLDDCVVSLAAATPETWLELAQRNIPELILRGNGYPPALHTLLQRVSALQVAGNSNVLNMENARPFKLSVYGDVDFATHGYLSNMKIAHLCIQDNATITLDTLTRIIAGQRPYIVEVTVVNCPLLPPEPPWSHIVTYHRR